MIKSKSINYLWLDGETTGLDPLRNDIVQLACIPVLSGVEQPIQFNQYCQPIDYNAIDPDALAMNGLDVPFLRQQQSATALINNLILFTKQFDCKFIIAGYNVGFDRDFLASMFKKVGREDDFYQIFTGDIRDTLKRARKLKAQLPTTNLKLATLAVHFGFDIKAHDAISDISATIKVDAKLSEMLGEIEIHVTEERELLDVSFPEPAQLHVHSMYSHTDSLNSVKDWAIWAHDNNIPGVAFVDHGNAASIYDALNIAGTFKKENESREKDKVPLLGVAPTCIPSSGLHVEHNKERFYLSAWATSNQGYKNLVKLASVGWNNRVDISTQEFPVISLNDVIARKDGIVFGIPGANGPIVQSLLNRTHGHATSLISYLHSNLDIRLELAAVDIYKYFDSDIGFRSYAIDGGNIQKHINKFYLETARNLGIKCVAVSDSHFIDPNDKVVQDCVSRNAYKDSRYFFESRHVVKAREMYSILKGQLGDLIVEEDFMDMVENSHEIARQASKIVVKHNYHLPEIAIPDAIKAKTDDYNMQTYYYMMSRIKEHGRWNNDPVYVERFKRELEVIMKNETLNFIPYFLVYEDICSYALSMGLMQGIARGSAGGSLLSYYLKIIHVDPVQYNLPFERFLSHARIRAGSFPDIDLDISRRARPLVMKYLQEKYGLGFAQISTFSKMKTKKAIKDAMYSLYGRSGKDPEVMAVCNDIADSPQGVDEHDFLYGYTDQEGVEHKGEVDLKPVLANFFKQRPEVEEMVKKLLGAIAGWSRHASAFVISTIDLADGRVPTMKFSDKELGEITVTQFDASRVEKSGLVKADILGITTLNMVSDCMDLVMQNHKLDMREEVNGVPFIYRLPDADKGVFTDFYNKDTDSSFQFNTELVKGYATEFAPLRRADCSAMTALLRPGALDAPLYDTTAAQYYMDVRNGKRSIEYLHEDLMPILADSNGVFVYQEEVMKFLVDIVGYTWEESDRIRDAIAKKKHEVIMNTFKKIRESCAKRGWTQEAIETICQQIQAFSRYSFNKSHSHAYGELGYITLYLKHHYPLEWWTAVLNNEDSSEKVKKYISYLGERVTAPSLRTPTPRFSIQNGKISAPISAIKSVGPAIVDELVTKGPFVSLEDFCTRVNHSRVNIGGMSALIKARAADDLMEAFSDEPDIMNTVDNIPTYIDARYIFMKRYLSLRKTKTEFKEDMYGLDPIKVFLQEKEYNSSFNKALLANPAIIPLLQAKWPALEATGRKGIPFMMKSSDEFRDDIPILGAVKVAEGFLKKKHAHEVGMILLYDSSSYKSGVSKKTGKTWHRVSVMLSDGYNLIEATLWDHKKALGWKKDTMVYVRGELKDGWKTSATLGISEIEKVE